MARQRGKYAHITPKLPKLPLIEPARRDIVTAVKNEITQSSDVVVPIDSEAKFIELMAEMEICLKQVLTLEKTRTGGRRWASEFAKAYQELRALIDKIKDWQSNVQLLLDAYTELMIDQMDVEGVKAVRLTDGSSVSTFEEPYAQVKDKEAFRQWCLKNGYANDLSLGWMKTNSIVKERLTLGQPEPEGVEIFSKTVIRLNT